MLQNGDSVICPLSFSLLSPSSLRSLLVAKEGTSQQAHPRRTEATAVGLCLGGGLVVVPEPLGQESPWDGDSFPPGTVDSGKAG